MEKMWAGRFEMNASEETDKFNSSINIDGRMYMQDIIGSIAHAEMLAKQGIISTNDAQSIVSGLTEILDDIESGKLEIRQDAEDIHMFIEGELTKRIGEAGKRLHTARSRNDQVATDTRLYLGERVDGTQKLIKELLATLLKLAKQHTTTVMSGYTHLQRAQPVTLAHHLLAYCAMLMRDYERLAESKKRTMVLPLGSCALAGTTYPINRQEVAKKLKMHGVAFNSMDGVSDRDFVVELCSDLSIIMCHLSRLSEEIVMWSSWEFGYIELSDAYTTGSSIMPQKKNPDLAELVRGKTGRVYGNLFSILTILKGLPLAYNKDMQEDKEGVFDSFDTVDACLSITEKMLSTAKFNTKRMLENASKGFINATDVADYLVQKGMAFRSAYRIVGELVGECIKRGETLETLPLEVYQAKSEKFSQDIYQAVDITVCAMRRNSEGGVAKEQTEEQIKKVDMFLNSKQ